MAATKEQVEQVYALVGDRPMTTTQVAKRTGLAAALVVECLRIIRQAEAEWAAACAQAEKLERLISYARPWREIDHGKTVGAVGKPASDTAPNGWSLLAFLGVVCGPPQNAEADFVSTALR